METDIIKNIQKLKNNNSLCTINPVEQIDVFLYDNLNNTSNFSLFNNFWIKCRVEYSDSFIFDFLVNFLTIQNKGKITNGVNVVKIFIFLFNQYKNKNIIDEFFIQIRKYIKYYNIIINEKKKNELINSLLHKINKSHNNEAYPYLMEVFEDYEYARINTEMLIEILNTVILFIEHRNDDNINTIVKSFDELSDEINKMLLLKVLTPKIVKVKVEN